MSHYGNGMLAAAGDLLIIGRTSLQNNFLARLLELNIGERCAVASIDELRLNPRGAGTVCLIDVAGMSRPEMENQFESLCGEPSVMAMALINADPMMDTESLLHWPKLQGFFFRDTSEEHFVKGVRALLNNECWLPRKLLAKHLAQTRGLHCFRVHEDVGLTRKETETLRAMATGAKNSDIANILHVSPHTVKTHIYNLFRKINANNRVQAVSWANTNLEPPHRADS